MQALLTNIWELFQYRLVPDQTANEQILPLELLNVDRLLVSWCSRVEEALRLSSDWSTAFTFGHFKVCLMLKHQSVRMGDCSFEANLHLHS